MGGSPLRLHFFGGGVPYDLFLGLPLVLLSRPVFVGDEDGFSSFPLSQLFFDPNLRTFFIDPMGDACLLHVLCARLPIGPLLCFGVAILLRLGILPLLRVSFLLEVLLVFRLGIPNLLRVSSLLRILPVLSRGGVPPLLRISSLLGGPPRV